MNDNKILFVKGIHDGIPIFLGYLAVSFTLGIAAKNVGLTVSQATWMSATNNTSAGEYAALGLIASHATYTEMAVTQIIINLRYCLMSCALSQKLAPTAPYFHRFLLGFYVTDEIFSASVCGDKKLNPFYSYGIIAAAAPGWAIGTFIGVVSGNILPERIISAMNIALYSMFIAVIIPPSKNNKILAGLIGVSMLSSLMFSYFPYIREISSGFRIIILTIVIALIAAVLFPIREKDEKEEECEENLSVHIGNGSSNISNSSIAAYLNSETS